MLVLNKTDLVTPQQAAQLTALLAKLNPAAKVRVQRRRARGARRRFALLQPCAAMYRACNPQSRMRGRGVQRGDKRATFSALLLLLPRRRPPQIVPTSHGRAPLSDILNTRRFSLERAQAAPGWLRELNAFEASLREWRARGGDDSGENGGSTPAARDGGAAASTSGRDHHHGHHHGHHHHGHDGHDHHHPRSEADEYGIASFVYYARRPFHPGRLLRDALSRTWGGVLRSKGFFWLATRHDVMGLWQSAGGAWQGEPRWACVCVTEPGGRCWGLGFALALLVAVL